MVKELGCVKTLEHYKCTVKHSFWSVNWHYLVHNLQKEVCNILVPNLQEWHQLHNPKSFHFNHMCHFFDSGT